MPELKDLYTKLQSANIQVPDYNTFQSKYSTEEGFKSLYGKLDSANVKLPTYDEFKSKYYSGIPERSNYEYLVDKSADFLGTAKDKLLKESNLTPSTTKSTIDQDVQEATKYFDIPLAGIGLTPKVTPDGKTTFDYTTPVFDNKQLLQEADKLGGWARYYKSEMSRRYEPIAEGQKRTDDTPEAEAEYIKNQKGVESATKMLNYVKGRIAQDFSLAGTKDKQGNYIVDPIKSEDSPVEIKQKLQGATQFLKEANVQDDKSLTQKLMTNAAQTLNAGDPNGLNKTLASITLAAKDNDGWIKQSPVDIQRLVYDGASFEKKSMQAQIEYKDKPLLDNVNKQIAEFDKLLADKTKKLTDEGYKQYHDLIDVKKNFEDKIAEENKYIGKIDNVIKTKVPDLEKYEAQQQYLNKLHEVYPISNTILTPVRNTATSILTAAQVWTAMATNAITNPEDVKLENGQTYSRKSADINALYGSSYARQEPQVYRNGKYVNLSQLDGIKLKDGKLTIDKTGLLFQTTDVALKSALLGITGGEGMALEEALYGSALESNALRAAALSEVNAPAFYTALNSAAKGGLEAGKYLTGTTVGFIAPSVLLFGPDMIKQELDKGLSYNQAVGLGTVRAGIEGLTERLFIDNILDVKKLIASGEISTLEHLTSNGTFKKAVEGVLERYTDKESAPYIFKFLYNLDGAALKSGSKEFAKILAGETLEEEAGLVLNHFATKFAQEHYKKDYEDTDPLTMENILNTAIQTMATMIPQGGIGFYTHFREQNQQRQYAQYQVGMAPSIYNSTIDKLIENKVVTDLEAQRRKDLVSHYSDIYKSKEEIFKHIDELPVTEEVKEAKKFEIFRNELKQRNINDVLSRSSVSDEVKDEATKEQETIKTDDEIVNETPVANTGNFEKDTLSTLEKELSPKNISEIKDTAHIDELIKTLDSHLSLPTGNVSKKFKEEIQTYKDSLEQRKDEIVLEKTAKDASNIEQVKSDISALIEEKNFDAANTSVKETIDAVLQSQSALEKDSEPYKILQDHLVDLYKFQDQIEQLQQDPNKAEREENLKQFRTTLTAGVAVNDGKENTEIVESYPDDYYRLANGKRVHASQLFPIVEVASPEDIKDLSDKWAQGDEEVIDRASKDITLAKAIKDYLAATGFNNELPEVPSEIEEAEFKAQPASVFRTIGLNVRNLFIQGTNIIDPAFKTGANAIRNIINDQTQDEFKVLVLRPSQLVERLGGLEAVKDKLPNDYVYWKKNGYGDETQVVKLVLVNANNDIVNFDEEGNKNPAGIPAIYNLPSIKTAETEFKRKGIEEQEEAFEEYKASLQQLKDIRSNPPIEPLPISKVNLGLVTKFVKDPIPTKSFTESLKGKFFSAGLTTPNLELVVTTTSQIGKVEGVSYLVDGKYGLQYPISRPKMGQVDIHGFINALVEIGTRSVSSRGLETFEDRRSMLDKFLYMDKDSISFGKNKFGEYFLIHNSFFTNYPDVTKIEGVKPLEDFLYFNIGVNTTDAFKEALAHAIKQKTLNIVPQEEGQFEVPVYSDGKLSFVKYDSYQEFIVENSNVYSDVNDVKGSQELLANGVGGFVGSYIQLNATDYIPSTSDVAEEMPAKPTVTQETIDEEIELLKSTKIENKFSNKEWNEVKDWWKDSPLSKFIDLNHFANIINSNAAGTFVNNVITLYQNSSPRTLLHEAWHGFSQLFLTKRQKNNLYNELRKKSGSIKIVDESTGLLTNKAYKDLTDKEAEEAIAESWEDYADSDGKMLFGKDLSKQTIFEKAWQFIKTLNGLLPNIQTYYDKLYKGNINNFSPNLNNALFGKLNKSFTANGVTIGSRTINDFVNLIDSSIINRLDRLKKSHILFTGIKENKTKNFKSLYDATLKDINIKIASGTLSDDAKQKLQFLADNFITEGTKVGFDQIYIQNSSLFSDIKAEEEKSSQDEEGLPVTTDEILSDDDHVETRDNIVEFKEQNKKSAIKQASNEIIYLLSTLSRGETDEYGFPKLLPLQTTWYRLATEVKGITDPEQMYGRIKQLGEKYPEYLQLLSRLPVLDNPANDVRQITLLQSFMKAFEKPLIEMYEGVMTIPRATKENPTPSPVFYNTKSSTKAINKLSKKLQASFATNDENPYVVKNAEGQNVLNTTKIGKDFGKVDKDGVLKLPKNKRIDFLKAIGVELNPLTIESDQFKALMEDNSKDIFNLIFDAVVNKLGKEDYDIKNPIQDIRGTRDLKKHFNFAGEASSIDAVLKAEINATNEYEEDLAINPNGDNVYQIQQFSKTSLTYAALNNREKYPTLQDLVSDPEWEHLDPQKNPSMRYTTWLNSLFKIRDERGNLISGTEYGKRRNSVIDLKNIGGFKTDTEKGITGAKTTDLFSLDKILFDINSFLYNNIIEHMRYADKGSSFGTELTYFTTKNKYPVNLAEFKGNNMPKQAVNIFEDYLKGTIAEIVKHNRITTNNAKSGYGVAKYSKNGSSFRIFEEILGQETKDFLRKEIETLANIGDENALDEAISKITNKINLQKPLQAFFSNSVSELKKRLRKAKTDNGNFLKDQLGLIDKKGLTYEEALNAFIVSAYIYNYEQGQLINGDVVQFKAADDFHKRLSADSATGDFSIMNKAVLGFLNATGRMQEFLLTGKKSSIGPSFRTSVFNDNEIKSQYLEQYLSDTIKSLGVDISTKELIDMPLKEAEKLLTEEHGAKGISIFTVLKAFKEVNETDALGLCTLDFYRNFKVAIGQWNDLAESAYIKAAQGLPLDEKEMYYFVPIKAQYSGTIANTPQVLGEYLRIDAFDKFALVPMMPSAIKGKGLEKISNNMIRNNIGYGVFESGSKKAALTKDGKFNDLYSENPLTNDKYWGYLKEQVYLEPKIKPNIIFATQFNKLFNVDLFNYGKSKSKRIDQIAKEYNETRQTLINRELTRVKNDLGIKKGKIDFKKLSDILKKEFKSRDLPDNIIDFLKTDENGNLAFSLDSSLSRQKMSSIILAIVSNRIIKGKLNGDNYIQTAFTGWRSDSNLKLPELKTREDGTQYVSKMEAKVSISKFKNLLNLKHPYEAGVIGTIEKLNRLLKDEDFMKDHEQELSMVGVRIPVQGANSMLNLIVEEFLPEETGSIIVLPSEITAIAGSDFDIDKVSMYVPNISDNGTLPQIGGAEVLNKINEVLNKYHVPKFLIQGIKEIFEEDLDIETRTKQIKDLVFQNYEELSQLQDKGNKRTQYNELKDFIPIIDEMITEFPKLNTKSFLQNKMISLLSESMSQPEMYEPLFTPNSTSVLKPLADDIKKMLGSKDKVNYSTVYDYNTQMNQFEANLVGKKSLGIAAKNNTFNQLFKQHNIYLNNVYDGDVPVNVYLDHNEFEGHPSLAGEYDKNGEYKISEIISQFINGFVDVAKDPWVFDLGATFEATPTLLYLTHLGVPIKQAVYLVNQPIVKDYLELKKMKNFQTGKALDSYYDGLTEEKMVNILAYKYESNVRDFDKYNKDNHEKIYTEKNLLKNINYLDNSKINTTFANEQRAILTHYLELEAQGRRLRELTSSLDFDTTKIKSIFSSFEKEALYNQVLSSNMFNKEGVEAIKNNSVISMLDMNKFIIDNFPKMFKVVELPEVNNFLLSVIGDASFGNKEKFENRFKNDLIGYAYNTLTTNYKEVVPFFEGQMVQRLEDLKKEIPSLVNEVPLLKEFVGDKGIKRPELVNIKTKTDLKETKDINTAIEDFKKGVEHSNPKVRDFFKDLIRFAFVQSGLQKSPISFTHILPTESISTDIEKVLPLLKQIVESPEMLKLFYTKYFMKNNAQVIQPKVLKENGYLTNKTHSYQDEAYRLKTPLQILNNPILEEEAKNIEIKPSRINVDDIESTIEDEKEPPLDEDVIPLSVGESLETEVTDFSEAPTDDELPENEIDDCAKKI